MLAEHALIKVTIRLLSIGSAVVGRLQWIRKRKFLRASRRNHSARRCRRFFWLASFLAKGPGKRLAHAKKGEEREKMWRYLTVTGQGQAWIVGPGASGQVALGPWHGRGAQASASSRNPACSRRFSSSVLARGKSISASHFRASSLNRDKPLPRITMVPSAGSWSGSRLAHPRRVN